MKLAPFVRVDAVSFAAASHDELRRRRGQPLREGRNRIGLHELDYGDVVFRFQDSGQLEEVTARAPVVHLRLSASPNVVAVPFASLASFVRDHDPSMFERVGFIVSPTFGLAFDPDCPDWVTALAAHCMPEWRKL